MQVLKVFTDPTFEARYSLSGRGYVFRFAHNARADRWYLSVYTESGDLVVGNRKLVAGVADLFRLCSNRKRPPGALTVAPTSKGLDSPTLANLGTEYALVYIEPGEDLSATVLG